MRSAGRWGLAHAQRVRGVLPTPRLAQLQHPIGRSAASTITAPPDRPEPPKLLDRSPGEWVGLYMELSKSRLSALVVVTTAAGHAMAAAPIDPTVAAATLGGTFLCAASANSFNQIIEIERDASMNRTMRRPLPSGRITPAHATGWAAASGLVGVGTLCALPTSTPPTSARVGAAPLSVDPCLACAVRLARMS
jgi:heme o synthase